MTTIEQIARELAEDITVSYGCENDTSNLADELLKILRSVAPPDGWGLDNDEKTNNK